MTTLKDLEKIVPEVIAELEKIAEDMSRYKKIKTDLRAYSLIQEINGKIKEIKLALAAYTRADLRQVYEKKDFDSYVEKIRAYVPEYRAVYERIKKFENITDYYADKPFKNEIFDNSNLTTTENVPAEPER